VFLKNSFSPKTKLPHLLKSGLHNPTHKRKEKKAPKNKKPPLASHLKQTVDTNLIKFRKKSPFFKPKVQKEINIQRQT